MQIRARGGEEFSVGIYVYEIGVEYGDPLSAAEGILPVKRNDESDTRRRMCDY